MCLSPEILEPRRLLSSVFTYGPQQHVISDANVPIGKTIQIPLATDYDGAVTYAIRTGARTVQAYLHPITNTFVQITVAGYDDPMVFELFNDVAPETVRRFTGLVNSGFYNGLTFHRVINNFVIQGGSPDGTGTGRPDSTSDDEFDPSTIFSGTGQLAMANGAKDDNGSQFFITDGPQRPLDFNNTIFGQLVRGQTTQQAISSVIVDADDRPIEPVTITNARVIRDTTDAVLQIKSLSATGTTVRVTAVTPDGNTSETFSVNPFPDTTNDPPILNALPKVFYVAENQPLVADLSATDLEGDPVVWNGLRITSEGVEDASIAADGHLVITPEQGFTGEIQLLVGVGVPGATSRGSTPSDPTQPVMNGIYDTQVITLAVGDTPIAATAYNLDVLSGSTAPALQVASFRERDSDKSASSFSARIDWGDGTVSSGTIVAGSRPGTYLVFGSKGYRSDASGAVPLTVTITDAGGATSVAEAVATARDFATLTDGLLSVYGTSGQDRIGISRKGQFYAVSVDGSTKAIAIGDVTSISVYGMAARDRIQLTDDVTADAYIEGGDGNDLIYGGGGSEIINAGNGNDYVLCGDGNTRVAGGNGNDSIYGGAGRDKLFGGGGDDFISGGPGKDLLGGDDGDDTLIGGTGPDTLYGGTGNDILNGLGGADLIFGGAGVDAAKRYDDDAYSRDVENVIG